MALDAAASLKRRDRDDGAARLRLERAARDYEPNLVDQVDSFGDQFYNRERSARWM